MFIKNIILLKNLKWAFCTLNSDYFLTQWSHAFDHLKSKFCKRIIIKVIKNSFINDDFSKKKAIISKIILLNKFLKEKKFKFIINKNLKLFFRKLKLNFIKMIIIIIIINSYTFVTLIKLIHEKLYAIYIEWTKFSEIENHSLFIQLLHAVKTIIMRLYIKLVCVNCMLKNE